MAQHGKDTTGLTINNSLEGMVTLGVQVKRGSLAEWLNMGEIHVCLIINNSFGRIVILGNKRGDFWLNGSAWVKHFL